MFFFFCFNVYCFNVQPGVDILYETGDSALNGKEITTLTTTTKTTTTKPSTTKTTTTKPSTTKATTTSRQQETGNKIYVTKSGKRYHYDSTCNGGTYYESTLQEALDRGLSPCSKCVLN